MILYISIFYNNNNSNSLLLLLLLLLHTTAYDDDDTVLRSDHSLNAVTGRRARTRRMFPMNGTRVESCVAGGVAEVVPTKL